VFGHNSGPLYQNVILTATVLISFFCADSIATELSDPFGDDANDLPLMDIMEAAIMAPMQPPMDDTEEPRLDGTSIVAFPGGINPSTDPPV